MKKFHYNLSPLVRLHTVEKSKVELELAKKMQEIKQYEEQLSREEINIREMLLDSEKSILKGKSVSLMSQPDFLNAKLYNIKLLKDKIVLMVKDREVILDKLGKIIGKINKLEDIRIEKIGEFKKEMNKKEQEDMEEVFRTKNLTNLP